jgi:hypothetical protein
MKINFFYFVALAFITFSDFANGAELFLSSHEGEVDLPKLRHGEVIPHNSTVGGNYFYTKDGNWLVEDFKIKKVKHLDGFEITLGIARLYQISNFEVEALQAITVDVLGYKNSSHYQYTWAKSNNNEYCEGRHIYKDPVHSTTNCMTIDVSDVNVGGINSKMVIIRVHATHFQKYFHYEFAVNPKVLGFDNLEGDDWNNLSTIHPNTKRQFVERFIGWASELRKAVTYSFTDTRNYFAEMNSWRNMATSKGVEN